MKIFGADATAVSNGIIPLVLHDIGMIGKLTLNAILVVQSNKWIGSSPN
jgi:hypothetical protein